MPKSKETTICQEIRIAASLETVFGFLTVAEKYIQWQGKAASLDPRPGGLFRVEMEGGQIARGEYVEVDRPRRIVITWGWEGDEEVPPASSRVEITLRTEGRETVLRLEHSGLPLGAPFAHHTEGWERYLPRLVEAAGGKDAGADPA